MKIDENLEESEFERCIEDEESKNWSCTRTGDVNQPARTDPEDRPEPEEDQPPLRPRARRRQLRSQFTRRGGGHDRGGQERCQNREELHWGIM